MKKLCAILLFSLATVACGGVHHIATVSVVSGHEILMQAQRTANEVTCGAAGAPVAPLCLPEADRNGVVATNLSTAFGLDAAVATLVRNWPGPPTALNIAPYLRQITDLIEQVIAALPNGKAKSILLTKIGAK